MFKALAKVNKAVLPSYSKRQLDLTKATKLQLAIMGWRWFVTKNALDWEKIGLTALFMMKLHFEKTANKKTRYFAGFGHFSKNHSLE